MKLGLLTAIWGRPEITQLVMDYYKDMPIDKLLCVVSSEDKAQYTLNFGRWDRITWPNQPLSNKWSAGMEHMKDCGAVIIVGSDDLITPKYVEACRYLLGQGVEYTYLEGAYFLDATTPRMCYATARRLGLGRCVSASLMNRMNWRPWPDGLDSGLDGNMEACMMGLEEPSREVRITNPVEHGFVGLDVKTGENIWSYDHVRNHLVVVDTDPREVLEKYFPSVSEKLLQWHERSFNTV